MKIKNYLFIVMLFITSVVFPQTGSTYTVSITSGGNNRSYLVYIPSMYNASKPVPLMLDIHGYTIRDDEQMKYLDFRPIADTANFIIACPQGTGNSWSCNGTVSAGQADRDYIWAMIDSIKAHYNINPCRVYTSGFSMGGFMSYILSINVDSPTRAPVIAAMASVSGGISNSNAPNSYWASKNPSHPTPVMEIHGDNDNTIQYAGSNSLGQVYCDTLMKYWVKFNQCNPTPTQTNFDNVTESPSCTVQHYIWSGGLRGSSVELYKIIGGGHTVPQNPAPNPQKGVTPGQDQDFNSALVIWQFCSKYCLPYLTSSTCTESPTISAQTGNSTICSGSSTTFAVTASGCVGTALTYQWQVNTGSGFTNITNAAPYSGVTTNTLTITSATTGLNTYQYRCFVGSCCHNANSTSATLTVNNCCTAPTITGTTPDSTCGTGTVTLKATSSAGTINWYAGATGGNSLFTGTSYTITNLSNTSTYYVDATNNGCTTSSRIAVIAQASTIPTATITGNATICSGTSSTISIALTGTAPWSFTYVSANGSVPVSGITTSTYTTNVSAGTYTLSAVSDASQCTGTFSGSATITPRTPIAVSTSTITCDGANANYTVEFDISGGDAASYTVDGSSANIVSSHYKSNAIASGTSYSLTVNDSYNCSALAVHGTKSCSVTCNATATISGNATICTGASSTISIALTGTAPWSFTYVSANGSIPVSGITTSMYTTNVSAGTYTLSAVSDANCTGTFNGSATITERTPIAVSTTTITCDGANANYTVEFDISGGDQASYTVDGSAANIVSSHYKSNAIASGTSCSLTVNDSYNCSALAVHGTKSCSVTCNATATISGDATICSGNSATISIALTGAAPWSVTYAIAGVNQTPFITSASTYTFTTTIAGVYTLASVSDGNSCAAAKSGSATINVNALPTVGSTVSPSATVCAGASVTLSGTGAATYSWSGGTVPITDGQSFIPALTQTYTVTGIDGNSCSNKATQTVTVNTLPLVGSTVSPSATVCSGSSITLSGTGATNYSWPGGVTDGQTFIPSSITYTVIGTDAATTCSNTSTRSITVTTCNNSGNVASVSITTSSNIICAGSAATFSATPTNGGTSPTYQWQVNNVNAGTNSSTFTSTSLNNGDQVSVVMVSNAPGVTGSPATSNSITITVNVLPAVGVTADPTVATICAGSSITLSGTGAANYSWSGGISNGVSFTPTATTTYTVTGTATSNCMNTATQKVTVNTCNLGTGIAENTSLQTFTVYPNPTNGIINITISNANGNTLVITVVNMFGTEVYNNIEKNIPADYSKQINLGDLATGMYYIKLSTGTAVKMNKLIIQ